MSTRSTLIAFHAACLLAALASLSLAQEDRRACAVQGLELDAPRVVTRPGVAVVAAKINVKAQKVKVLWDVTARFADKDAEDSFAWEVRPDGRSVQVVVPDSKGVISVLAWAIADCEPTSARPARTTVTVDYQPRGAKSDKGEPAPQPVPDVPGVETPRETPVLAVPRPSRTKVSDVCFIVDRHDYGTQDADAVALAQSRTTQNAVRKLGANYHIFEPGGAEVRQWGLERFVKDCGGPPCAVYCVPAAKDYVVRKVLPLTKKTTLQDVLKPLE